MKPRPFDYARPDTVEEVLALLAEYGDDARILAGGQSLLPMLNLRLIDPAALIDISRIAGLDAIRDRGDIIEIGAAVTQNKLMAWPQLKLKLPLLAAALPFVGHFQTRNKGTVCGSIAHADPSSEIPLALAVAGGAVVLRSQQRGERVLAAEAFQQDMLTTARAPDELIAAVRFPVIEGKGVAFDEVARRHGDFAIIALAAIADRTRLGAARCRRHGRAADAARDRRRCRGRHRRLGGGTRRLRGFACLGGAAARSVAQSRATGDGGGDPMRRLSKNDRVRIALTLNGRKLAAEAEPRMLLSDFLRQGLGSTGTHVGCEHGICGACTVLIDGVATRSCLTLAVQAEGRDIKTVESLAAPDGALNPLQTAFRANHALQCGFCTPGILMSFTDYLARNPHPTTAEIREVLSGHLCRCTGYAGIVEAVEDVAISSPRKGVGTAHRCHPEVARAKRPARRCDGPGRAPSSLAARRPFPA